MAHPYRSQADSSKARRRGALSGGNRSGSKEGKLISAAKSEAKPSISDISVGGRKSLSRFARGGKVRPRGNVNVNILMPQSGGQDHPQPIPIPIPAPPPGPPGGGGPPMVPPPGGPPMPPPMMRARGGRIKKQTGGAADRATNLENDTPSTPLSTVPDEMRRRAGSNGNVAGKAGRASGGRIHMTAGAESGKGRLQKARQYNARRP